MSNEEIMLKCLELGLKRCIDNKDEFAKDIDIKSAALSYYEFVTSKTMA